MQIKRGTWRTVLLIPALGIVIKFPRIYWRRAWRRILANYHKKGWWQKELFRVDTFSIAVPYVKSSLLRGIVENWNEWRFYKKYKHIFCQPTFFSLFGLVNLQKYGLICQLEHYDFCDQYYLLPKGQVLRGSHHWSPPENFVFEDGTLKMVDYGHPQVQAEILEMGEMVQSQFDPNYKSPYIKKE